MSDIAIKAENISKAYQLGEFSTGTLSHDLERVWAKIRGKEDPFLKIGETNDRTKKSESNIVWSLKDINFEIKQGDAVGIIGRNGAGKSTLLKILSKVTSPTTGRLTGRGRIASLLEVGTGFHPELTGRENIYLNGAILGMRKAEIKRQFDQIVDFSGVERYIDTPVKRYSSGMYVRLAFAVAAHLESEILIVDEVLAVGDAEFQKKCLGKMGEVSKGEGRTVLFVSHNMAAISTLCNEGLLMKNGEVVDYGKCEFIIDKYISTDTSNVGLLLENDIKLSRSNDNLRFKKIALIGKNGPSTSFGINEDIVLELEYAVVNYATMVVPTIHLLNKYGDCLLASFNADSANLGKDVFFGLRQDVGTYVVSCIIPRFFLNDAQFSINAFLSPDISFTNMTEAREVIGFEVNETGEMRKEYNNTWIGQVRPRLAWETKKLS